MDPIALVPIAVSSVGVLLVIIGIALIVRRTAASKRLLPADAAVVAVEHYRSPRGIVDHELRRPTVRFTTARGQPVEFQPAHYSNLWTQPVGARIAVQYDPDRPGVVVIGAARSLGYWIPPIVCLLAGAVMIGASLIVSYVLVGLRP